MSCAELRARLEAYARGTLPAGEAAAFEDHLTSCAECSAFLDAAEPERSDAGALPRSVEPAADLWPGIRGRLRPRGSRAPRVTVPAWGLAAAAVLLIALSSSATLWWLRRSAPPPAVRSADAVASIELDYASAATELGAALVQARTRLAPATVATIERNLAVIDSALAESRRALAGDPGNAALEYLVLASWRQKVDFLRRATALLPAG